VNLRLVAEFKKMLGESSAEVREEASRYALEASGHLDRRLPAIPEGDRAAVAWVIADVVSAIGALPLSDVSGRLDATVLGYRSAALKFLGWEG
jgi:hypothetical protein